jgi:hypothetical protein
MPKHERRRERFSAASPIPPRLGRFGCTHGEALVRGSTLNSQSSQPTAASPTDRTRLGTAKLGHPIQDAARKARLDASATTTPGAQTIPNDGLVPEEGVLHASLPVVAHHQPHGRTLRLPERLERSLCSRWRGPARSWQRDTVPAASPIPPRLGAIRVHGRGRP